MSLPDSPIVPTIPLYAEGKNHGYLRLPYSRNDSAWGSVMIPITVIRNGSGPTALLTGGNHGDEYEGPIALQALTHDLEPAEVTGRIIIVPFMNHPAFLAGTRVSPLDGGNLNRLFPGRPDGTVTQKIADYFIRTLVPMADIVLDFHSGGKTLEFVPFAAAHVLDDAEHQGRCIAAMEAFNAPYSMTLREIDPVGMFDTSVEALGKTFVSTEIYGGGTASARSARIARKGTVNVLKHAGILAGEPDCAPSTAIDTTPAGCYHFAEMTGMMEPLVDLGETVAEGDALMRIWLTTNTGDPPLTVRSKRDGILAGRHFPGLVKLGDCLAVVASPIED
ncbi:N(2)-acetyl-L-2,4-diaminobutanoate deacetylase DoeB [Acuticoccus sp. I52.16.1]|uniref:N(2)-acetyl-L-2,4-diaminobutanoate deacetylase DoeB n=1 Tax=Acuticoccus sp. I52.16.1 TaxID=2928472 RepID=UPI001FD09C98|nr:N(2)-acetyl-L-2,4-diaminobutanoate deacetylase DoeB [Acuticoccus sp. I52.16.1]UOM32727.1 N(2)-acetyl-L-2,4-diaminobutanoate deacetylase DoeB [Acuticoccus sp. I52.16.1]